MKNKLILSSLAIEITRKCNMQPPCKHCFRGDAEQLDIQESVIDNLLVQIDKIDELCITGGEPLLNISAMRYLFERIKSNRIKLGHVSLVTNGLLASDDFTSLMIDMEEYLPHDNCSPCIEIGVSYDRYHSNNDGEEFSLICEDIFQGKSIAIIKQMTGANPLRIGRAENLGWCETTKHRQPHDLDAAVTVLKGNQIETQLYLSAKGLLYTGSVATNTYQYIDNAPPICNLNSTVSITQAIQKYNEGLKPKQLCEATERTLAEAFTENVNLYLRMLVIVQNPLYGFSKKDRDLAAKDYSEITEIYNDYETISMSGAMMIWLDNMINNSVCKDKDSNFAIIRTALLQELSTM